MLNLSGLTQQTMEQDWKELQKKLLKHSYIVQMGKNANQGKSIVCCLNDQQHQKENSMTEEHLELAQQLDQMRKDVSVIGQRLHSKYERLLHYIIALLLNFPIVGLDIRRQIILSSVL